MPLPAPASSSSSPSRRSIAAACSAVQSRRASAWLRSLAATDPREGASLARAVLRAGIEPARPQPRGDGHRARDGIVELAGELLRRAAIPVHHAGSIPRSGEEHAPPPEVIPTQRLVEATDGIEAGELTDHDQIQRDLQPPVDAPARGRPIGPPGAALVVATIAWPAPSTSTRSIIPRMSTRSAPSPRSSGGSEGRPSSPSPKPNRNSRPKRPPAILDAGLVAQITPQVGLDGPQGPRSRPPAGPPREPPPAPAPDSCRSRPRISGARQRGRLRGPSSSASRRSRMACMRFPRTIGSGSGSSGAGRSSRSMSHLTGQSP